MQCYESKRNYLHKDSSFSLCMGGNIFGYPIIVKVTPGNVQSKKIEKPNAEGFDKFQSLYA